MPGGRPTKRTLSAKDTIVQAIGLGATYARAAAAAGITYETLNEWRKDDSEFSEAINKAEADRVAKALQAIQRAATDSWQAAAWYLERRYPSEYGRTVQEQQHSGGVNINFNLTKRKENSAASRESEASE